MESTVINWIPRIAQNTSWSYSSPIGGLKFIEKVEKGLHPNEVKAVNWPTSSSERVKESFHPVYTHYEDALYLVIEWFLFGLENYCSHRCYDSSKEPWKTNEKNTSFTCDYWLTIKLLPHSKISLKEIIMQNVSHGS